MVMVYFRLRQYFFFFFLLSGSTFDLDTMAACWSIRTSRSQIRNVVAVNGHT